MTTQEPENSETNEIPDESTGKAEEPTDPITALEQERDQFKAIAQRTQADFLNFKRRTDQERGMLVRNASGQVMARLIPVQDDLERAVEALPADAPASWKDGISMVLQNVHAIMQAEGVTKYEPTPGDTFDPAEQEAVFYQPTTDQPPGAVLTVVRPGYRSSDRVLRPAQVVVAKAPEESAEAGSN
jgi:molecular chaperone GrpE